MKRSHNKHTEIRPPYLGNCQMLQKKCFGKNSYLDSATIPEVILFEADWEPNLHEATIIGFMRS